MTFTVKTPRENVVWLVVVLGLAVATAALLAFDLSRRPTGPSRVEWPAATKP